MKERNVEATGLIEDEEKCERQKYKSYRIEKCHEERSSEFSVPFYLFLVDHPLTVAGIFSKREHNYRRREFESLLFQGPRFTVCKFV